MERPTDGVEVDIDADVVEVDIVVPGLLRAWCSCIDGGTSTSEDKTLGVSVARDSCLLPTAGRVMVGVAVMVDAVVVICW